MNILRPAHRLWPMPSDALPLVEVEANRFGDVDVTIRLGADPADVVVALASVPPRARLARALGEADLTLLFRTVSTDPECLEQLPSIGASASASVGAEHPPARRHLAA